MARRRLTSSVITTLGSYVARATDLAIRKERGNKALWTNKRRLRGSTLPKKLQERIVEACVESTILFDCQTRSWSEREKSNSSRIAGRGYTYIWRHKNGGPTKIQMERRTTNLYGVRRALGIKFIQKIEKWGISSACPMKGLQNKLLWDSTSQKPTTYQLEANRLPSATGGNW